MGVEGLDAAKGDSSQESENRTEREDPVAKHERQQKEKDEARRARSERLGHEIVEEKTETKTQSKKKTAEKKAEAENTSPDAA